MEAYLDVGGTHLRYIVIDDNQLIESNDISSSQIDLYEFLEMLIKKHKNISKIGISFAGQVESGKIVSAPNITIKEIDIRDYFNKKYGIDLKIENDLKAIALAEVSFFDTNELLVVLYVGTGIGSAFVDKKRLICGKNNLAGEIGHIPYKKAPFKCGCGKDDCLELYASGIGLLKWANYYNLKANTLKELKAIDDKRALKIVDEFHEALIFGVSTLITLLNPSILVLGGGVIENNPYLLELIKDGVSKKAMKKQANEVRIFKSSIKSAGIEGAKLLFGHNNE